jgi:hypothetical protein
MSHANYSIVLQATHYLILQDMGPWSQHPTITNDAEWVVEQVAAQLDGRMLLYFDSEGWLDQIQVKEGKFVGFASGWRWPNE